MEELYHTTCNCSQFFRSEQVNGNAVSVDVDAYSTGQICAEYLYDYPPGIPFLIPGEFITRKIIEILEKEAENGRAFYGHRGREGVILCLRE